MLFQFFYKITFFTTLRAIFQYEAQHNLTKFEGSSSISSDDLFGTGDKSRKPSSSSYYGTGTDFQDIKEGVKQGVSKVAGRLSNIASGVMSSLQVCRLCFHLSLYLVILELRHKDSLSTFKSALKTHHFHQQTRL